MHADIEPASKDVRAFLGSHEEELATVATQLTSGRLAEVFPTIARIFGGPFGEFAAKLLQRPNRNDRAFAAFLRELSAQEERQSQARMVARYVVEALEGYFSEAGLNRPFLSYQMGELRQMVTQDGVVDVPAIGVNYADVPQIPEFFCGREPALARLQEMLGNAKESLDGSPVAISAVRGFMGIGKTALAAVLVRRFAAEFERVLWTTVGEERRLARLIARWGRQLSNAALASSASDEEALQSLGAAVADRCVLIVLDDLWRPEAVEPLQRILGRGSAMLLTTRLSGLPGEAGVTATHVYDVPPLDMPEALGLLYSLCPSLAERHAAQCEALLRRLECLPLAIHVAGRLLQDEVNAQLDVAQRIQEIDGALLLAEAAPCGAREGAPASVRALLQRSVDALGKDERARFAQLAVFGAASTFDLRGLAGVWDVADARPLVRSLHRRGILQPMGGRYRIHSLFHELALRMLEDAHDDPNAK
jgi:hypothetical protein